MRDKVKDEYHGKGVKQAISNVNGPIAGELVGKDLDIANQEAMDKILLDLDGTKNKEKLGANAILGVSLAIAKAAAAHQKLPLYKHLAKLAGNETNKMLLPHGAQSFTEAMRMGSETYHHLKSITKKKF